jgi:hypothetical protein
MSATDWHQLLGLDANWEKRIQITLIEPPRQIAVPGQEPRAAPRRNIVLSLVANTADTTQTACANFVTQTASVVPGLVELDRDDVTFTDGAPGSRVVVEFAAAPDARLRQTHFFRIDGDTLAQIVATVDADVTSDADEQALVAAGLRYRPPGS